jgi:hypothetical protein
MGLLNETNQTNRALADVYGIRSHAVVGTEAGVGTNEIVFIKQDLAYVDVLTTAAVTSQVSEYHSDAPHYMYIICGEAPLKYNEGRPQS